MMPTCGFRGWFGHRCNQVAEQNIGEIVTGSGETDGFGNPWQQRHYLCDRHARKLLKLLGFSLTTPEQKGKQ